MSWLSSFVKNPGKAVARAAGNAVGAVLTPVTSTISLLGNVYNAAATGDYSGIAGDLANYAGDVGGGIATLASGGTANVKPKGAQMLGATTTSDVMQEKSLKKAEQRAAEDAQAIAAEATRMRKSTITSLLGNSSFGRSQSLLGSVANRGNIL